MATRSWWKQVFNRPATRASRQLKRRKRQPDFKPLMMRLEDRINPAVTDFTNNILTIDFNNAGEIVSLFNDGTNITITSNNAIIGAGDTFAASDVNRIVVTDSGSLASQTITLEGSVPYALPEGFSSSGVESVRFFQELNAGGGNAAIEVSATTTIDVQAGAHLTGGSGGVTLVGGGSPTASTTGVRILSAAVSTTNDGNVTINGTGGGGTGDGILGVNVAGANAIITSGGSGSVTVTGVGGSGSGIANSGVNVQNGAVISSGGSGTVSVTGSSTGTGIASHGVRVSGGGAKISSGGGELFIEATGTSISEALFLQITGSISSGNNADITITADSVSILTAGTINSGTGTTTIQTRTAGTKIDLGGADVLTGSPLTLGLSSPELNQITAGTLIIGRNDIASGTITISSPIAPTGTDTLSLITAADVTQTATITNENLSVQAITGIALGAANTINTVALSNSDAGGISFNNANSYTIGTVDGLSGATANGQAVSLTASAGTITVDKAVSATGAGGSATITAGQSVVVNANITGGDDGTSITGQGLAAVNSVGVTVQSGAVVTTTGAGTVSITGTGGAGSGSFNDGVRVTSASVITSGGSGKVTVEGTGGAGSGDGNYGVLVSGTNSVITSGGSGTVTVTGTGGSGSGLVNVGVDVTLAGVITAGGIGTVTVNGTGGTGAGFSNFGVRVLSSGMITSAGGSVEVTATGNTNTNPAEALRLNSSGAITSGNNADITITADSMNLLAGSGTINSGAGTTTIRTRTAGTKIDLGGDDVLTGSPLTLGLSSAELNQITAGTLIIGRNDIASGTITVSNPIAPTGTNTLSLITAADITGTGTITQTNVALRAATGIILNSDNAIENLAAVNSTSGGVTVNNAADLTVSDTAIDGLAGVTASGQTINLSTTSSGSLTLNAAVTGDMVSLTSANDLNSNIDGTIAGSTSMTLSNAGTGTLNGVISGGKLDYNGTGTLTLAATNSYTGVTTVNGGTLLINGSITSDTTINNAATLGGVGTITGTVDVNDAATLAPGNSTGILNTGSVTFESDTDFNVQLAGTSVGTEYDQLNVTGTVALSSANLNLTLDFTPNVGDSFIIIQNDGADAIAGTFADLVEGATFTVNSTLFQITYQGGTGNDVALTVVGPVDPSLNGTPGDDVFIVRRNGDDLEVLLNNNIIFIEHIDDLTDITLNGLDGADTFIVDFDFGGIFDLPIFVDGGLPTTAPGDELIVIGGQFTTITKTFINASDGMIEFAEGPVISYMGLEPVLINVGTVDDIIFILPAGPSNAILEDDGTVGNNLSTLRSNPITFETTTFTNPTNSITILTGNGADTLTIDDIPDLTSSIIVGTATDRFDSVTIDGTADIGTNSLEAFANKILVTGSVTAGDITLDADAGASLAGTYIGVDINDGKLLATDGDITLIGRGGDTAAENYGVRVTNNAQVSAENSGGVTITGFGGSSAASKNYGLIVSNAGKVTTESGTININGTGGGGSGSNYGVYVVNPASELSSSVGDIIIVGQGGAPTGSGDENIGVHLRNQAKIQTGGSGSIDITGIGGSGTGERNYGVQVVTKAVVTATGTGSVTVTGAGGVGTGNDNFGVYVDDLGSKITAGSGGIIVTATGNTNVNPAEALRIEDDGLISTSDDGEITIIADSVNLLSDSSIDSGAGVTNFFTRTAGTNIDVGGNNVLSGSPLTLGLSQAELDRITAGTLNIGDSKAGDITISQNVSFTGNLNLLTDANINALAEVELNVDKNLTLTANGISIGTAANLTTIGTGTITISAKNNTEIDEAVISGNAGVIIDSKVTLTGDVTLSSADGDVSITGTVNSNPAGENGLTITAKQAELLGSVGDNLPLDFLAIVANSIEFGTLAEQVITANNQSYSGEVLFLASTVGYQSDNGDIQFDNGLRGDSGANSVNITGGGDLIVTGNIADVNNISITAENFFLANKIVATGTSTADVTNRLEVTGTADPDTMIVRTNGDRFEFGYAGGTFTKFTATAFEFLAGDGDDNLIIDLRNGLPDLLPATIFYDGGAGDDLIQVFGDGLLEATYSATGKGKGFVDVESLNMEFVNLTPVDMIGFAVANVQLLDKYDVDIINGTTFGDDPDTGMQEDAIIVQDATGMDEFEAVALRNNTSVNILTGGGGGIVNVALPNNNHGNINLDIDADTDDIVISDDIVLTGDLSLFTDSITGMGNIIAGSVSTDSLGDTTITGNITATDGDIVSIADNFNITGQLQATDTVELITVGNVIIGNGILAGNEVSTFSDTLTVSMGGITAATGDVFTVTAGDTDITENVTAGLSIIGIADNYTVSGSVLAGMDVDLLADGNVTIGEGVLASNDVSVIADTLTVSSGGVTAISGNVLTDTLGNTDISGDVVAGGSVVGDADNYTVSGSVIAGTDVDLLVDGDVTIGQGVLAGNDVFVIADTLTVSSGGITAINGNVLTDTLGNTDISGDVVAAGLTNALAQNYSVDGMVVSATESVAITSPGDVSIANGLMAGSTVTISGPGGNFANSITLGNNAEGKAITAGGHVTLESVNVTSITGQIKSGSLTIDASSIEFNDASGNGKIITNGNQVFNGPVVVSPSTILFQSVGGSIAFNDTLNGKVSGKSAVTVTAATTITFSGEVGTVQPLQSLTVSGQAMTNIDGGQVHTTGNQVYQTPVLLGGDTTFKSVQAANPLAVGTGNITFAKTLSGAPGKTPNLTITTDGTTKLVGNISNINSLTVDGSAPCVGTTIIQASSISTIADQTYSDTVILANNVSFATQGGNITFNCTVDADSAASKRNVTFTTNGTGIVTFAKAVGFASRPNQVTFSSVSDITVAAGLRAQGLVQVTQANDVKVSNGLDTDGSINVVKANKLLSADGDIQAGQSIKVNATNGVSVINGNMTASQSSITVTSSQGGLAVTGNLSAGSFVDVSTNKDIVVGGNLLANGSFAKLTSQYGKVNVGNNLTANSFVQVKALNGPVQVGNNLSASAGNVTINANQLQVGNNLTSGQSTLLTIANSAVVSGKLAAGAGVTVQASSLTVGGGVVAQNMISINTAGQTKISNGIVSKSSAIDIQAGSLIITGGLNAKTNASLSIVNAASISGGVVVGQNLTANTGSFTVNNGIQIGGNTTATAKQDVVINGGGSTAGLFKVTNAANVTLGGSYTFGRLVQENGSGVTRLTNGVITTQNGVNLKTAAIEINSGINAPGQTVLFNATSGGVSQTSSSSGIQVAELDLRGNGAFTLDNAANRIDNLFRAKVNGSTVLRVGSSLTIDNQVGVTVGNHPLTIYAGGNFSLIDQRPLGAGNDIFQTGRYSTPLIDAGNSKVLIVPGLAGDESQPVQFTFDAEIRAGSAQFGNQAGTQDPSSPFNVNNVRPDEFRVRPSQFTVITVFGNNPTQAPGDSIFPITTNAGITSVQFFRDGTLPASLQLAGQYLATFANGAKGQLFFREIESLGNLGYRAFAVQTGIRDYSVRLQLIQDQPLGGSVTGQAIEPNPFVVSPVTINPDVPFSSPQIAFADVNDDGQADLIIANGPGDLPLVTIIRGSRLFDLSAQNGVQQPSIRLDQLNFEEDLIAQFFAFEPEFLGGVSVAAADFTGNGKAEVVVGARDTGGPRIRLFALRDDADQLSVFDAMTNDFALLPLTAKASPLFSGENSKRDFFAFEPEFRGGVSVATGDINNDGIPDLIIGAGPGGGPRVLVYSGSNVELLDNFFAYDGALRGGVIVAAGNFTGFGGDEILTGPGLGGSPHIQVFGYDTGSRQLRASFFAWDFDTAGNTVINPLGVTGVASVAFGAPGTFGFETIGAGSADARQEILISSAKGPRLQMKRFTFQDVDFGQEQTVFEPSSRFNLFDELTDPNAPFFGIPVNDPFLGVPLRAVDLFEGGTVAGFSSIGEAAQ